MLNRKSFQKLNLYHFEPVAYLLIEKLRLTPVSFGLWSLIATTGLNLLTAWISNTLWFQQGKGLLNDPIPWVATLFANPIVWGYYLWSYHGLIKVIDNLEASDVIETNESEIDGILRDMYCRKWRKFLALLSAVSFSILVFVTQLGLRDRWAGSGFLPNIVITVDTFAGIYMSSILVLNLITNIKIFYKVLESKSLKVNPLHPDRCGGLKSLSDYSLKTAYLVAVLGIWVGVIEYQVIGKQGYWFVHLIIPLYIFVSMMCFFGPLWTAHRSMKKSKEELLNQIARQFQTDYSNIHSTLRNGAETIKQGIEKVQQLRNLYTMTDEFPVWPFDVQTFRRYLLTAPTPLLPLLISLLQKLIESLLKKWGVLV